MSVENSRTGNSVSSANTDPESQVVIKTSFVQWVRQNPRKAAAYAFGAVALLALILGLALGLSHSKSSASASAKTSTSSASTVPEYDGSVDFSVSCAVSGSTVTVSALPSDATCIIRTDTFERALVSNGVATFDGVSDVSSLSLELFTAESGEFDCTGSIGEAVCSA